MSEDTRGLLWMRWQKTLALQNHLFTITSKAKSQLDWESRWGFKETIKHTADWYEHYYQQDDIYEYSLSQIKQYLTIKGMKL